MNEEQLKEIAILAKELGFKTRTLSTGVTFEKFTRVDKGLPINDTCYYLLLCEIQLWLIVDHKLVTTSLLRSVDYMNSNTLEFKTRVQDISMSNLFSSIGRYDTYQDALSDGILEALKLIKNGTKVIALDNKT